MNQYIPVFLIVLSSIGFALLPVRLFLACIYCRTKAGSIITIVAELCILLLHFVGIIPLNVYTFQGWREWNHNGKLSCSNHASCCDPTLMYFAYIMIYIVDGVSVLFGAILIIYYIYKCNYKHDVELPSESISTI